MSVGNIREGLAVVRNEIRDMTIPDLNAEDIGTATITTMLGEVVKVLHAVHSQRGSRLRVAEEQIGMTCMNAKWAGDRIANLTEGSPNDHARLARTGMAGVEAMMREGVDAADTMQAALRRALGYVTLACEELQTGEAAWTASTTSMDSARAERQLSLVQLDLYLEGLA